MYCTGRILNKFTQQGIYRYFLQDMFSKIAHGKLLITMGTGCLDPFMDFTHVSNNVVYTDILLTIWTVCLLSQMNALHVILQHPFGLKLFLALRALVFLDLLMYKLHMMM